MKLGARRWNGRPSANRPPTIFSRVRDTPASALTIARDNARGAGVLSRQPRRGAGGPAPAPITFEPLTRSTFVARPESGASRELPCWSTLMRLAGGTPCPDAPMSFLVSVADQLKPLAAEERADQVANATEEPRKWLGSLTCRQLLSLADRRTVAPQSISWSERNAPAGVSPLCRKVF